jgi:hypothetical protein
MAFQLIFTVLTLFNVLPPKVGPGVEWKNQTNYFYSNEVANITDAANISGTANATIATIATIPQYVSLTNNIRNNVIPKANPALPSAVWSLSLEQYAKQTASTCLFRHSGSGLGSVYGQNIYAAAGFVPTWTNIIGLWGSEAAYYNYYTKTCAVGKVCGHYTQTVWRSSTHIGCYYQKCTTNSPFGFYSSTWYFAVCDYTGVGNYLGERPY